MKSRNEQELIPMKFVSELGFDVFCTDNVNERYADPYVEEADIMNAKIYQIENT
jgi:hypothetical protein